MPKRPFWPLRAWCLPFEIVPSEMFSPVQPSQPFLRFEPCEIIHCLDVIESKPWLAAVDLRAPNGRGLHQLELFQKCSVFQLVQANSCLELTDFELPLKSIHKPHRRLCSAGQVIVDCARIYHAAVTFVTLFSIKSIARLFRRDFYGCLLRSSEKEEQPRVPEQIKACSGFLRANLHLILRTPRCSPSESRV